MRLDEPLSRWLWLWLIKWLLARLDVEYPERLSRGLALVKWWLLAIPHYLILGLCVANSR